MRESLPTARVCSVRAVVSRFTRLTDLRQNTMATKWTKDQADLEALPNVEDEDDANEESCDSTRDRTRQRGCYTRHAARKRFRTG